MKNAIKWFGVIALVAIIGFSMVACGGNDDDNGGGGGIPQELIGEWKPDGIFMSFEFTKDKYKTMGMDFPARKNGDAIEIKESSSGPWEVLFSSYKVEGDTLTYTDPDHPRDTLTAQRKK